MRTIWQIFQAWLKWHNHWDDLCNRCGQCCYVRHLGENGEVIVDYFEPCEYLNTKTHLCRVYPERFQKCAYCGKVNLWVALFHKTLPEDCAYRQTFRVWEHKNENGDGGN